MEISNCQDYSSCSNSGAPLTLVLSTAPNRRPARLVLGIESIGTSFERRSLSVIRPGGSGLRSSRGLMSCPKLSGGSIPFCAIPA